MQQAKLHWLQTHPEQPALLLPYYWAAMQYSGHLQAVPLQPPARPISWLYWVGEDCVTNGDRSVLKKESILPEYIVRPDVQHHPDQLLTALTVTAIRRLYRHCSNKTPKSIYICHRPGYHLF